MKILTGQKFFGELEPGTAFYFGGKGGEGVLCMKGNINTFPGKVDSGSGAITMQPHYRPFINLENGAIELASESLSVIPAPEAFIDAKLKG